SVTCSGTSAVTVKIVSDSCKDVVLKVTSNSQIIVQSMAKNTLMISHDVIEQYSDLMPAGAPIIITPNATGMMSSNPRPVRFQRARVLTRRLMDAVFLILLYRYVTVTGGLLSMATHRHPVHYYQNGNLPSRNRRP
ncbi:MAG: hypothetical protein ACYS30_24160, partial [Planctomycetota bacterium]